MKYGIISDIHGNLEAFRVVLERIGGLDKHICLGDMVGYGPNPNECVDLAHEHKIPTVAGNHDKACTGELNVTWFNRDAADAIRWTQRELKTSSLEFLKDLPTHLEFEDFEIVHGSLRNHVEEYIMSLFDAMPTFELMKKPLLFVGHTHVPACVVMKQNGDFDGWKLEDGDVVGLKEFKKAILNVGGVGQPRDGDPRASYGVYDSEKKEVSIYRVPYDISKVQVKMREAGLPVHLIERLEYGM